MVTNREQFNALVTAMQDDQANALKEVADLFSSDDMAALVEKLTELRDRMIPNQNYDQIMSSGINVINSIKMMSAQFLPTPAVPADQQIVDQNA